ncbi:MAG: type II toxin-antitoxin system prevent-host-death family antitoxin [Actinomycetales bacterium]|nr:type II toxin-antitoxin system prevent-host-death family antitoxin [Actinomycetales bacterium]
MASVGIRDLKQNASAVVARAAAGETITITDRGRPVAQIGPRTTHGLQSLREQGLLREPRRPAADLPLPEPLTPGARPLSEVLEEDREDRL